MSRLPLVTHQGPPGPAAWPLRPGLGGTVPGTTPGAPTPTPGSGGTGGAGSGGETITTAEQYATYLVLLSAAVFGVIGFFQGVSRTFTAFVFTVGAAFVIGTRWDLVAALTNRFYKLFMFALKGGPLAEDPAKAWAAVKDLPGIVPTTGSAATFWQLVFFAGAVLLGYGIGILLFDAPNKGPLNVRAVSVFLSRMFGAFFGALTGATIALFVLPRIVPGANIDIVGPGSVLRNLVDQYGTILFWSFVLLMIVSGFMALRPKPSNKVFN
jgi:hypothetical protein